MICQEKLLTALRTTHQALIACSACLCEAGPEVECEELRDLMCTLATQADRMHRRLMDSCGMRARVTHSHPEQEGTQNV